MRVLIIICAITCIQLQSPIVVYADVDPVIAGGADHPCYRECVEGEVMTCTYNFTVTTFTAMSSACNGCPDNVTACYNEGCISSGGIVRPVTVVNKRVPGPAILVCYGDTVIVNVVNAMESDGLTIHWHGITQKETPYMDGAPYVTQCPITAHDSFQYKFQAVPAGTQIWHSHTSMHEADGVFGALVVRRPLTTEPSSQYYDYDLPEHTMVIWHWTAQATAAAFFNAFNNNKMFMGNGFIINGKGGLENFDNGYENTFDTMPREVFTVEKGNRYRFRTIFNSAPHCPVQVSVDNHKLLVITSDCAAVEPVEVDSFFVSEGERYDFVLTADQEVGNYWIRIRGIGDCRNMSVAVHQEAILRYSGAPEELPAGTHTYEDSNRHGVLLNPILQAVEDYSEDSVLLITDLNNTDTDQDIDVSGEPYQVTYMALSKNTYDTSVVKNSYVQINGVTFAAPSISLLTQRDNVTADMYCTGETVDPKFCKEGYCSCPYVLEYPSNKLIEIVMVGLNTSEPDHPMHTHGHQFRVVAMGILDNISVDMVRQLNEDGKIPKKFVGSPMKDTVPVPGSGYAIIRFVTLNPGYWFFHCHVSHHASLGMLSVLKFGDHSEMPETPADFPKCGNWKLPED